MYDSFHQAGFEDSVLNSKDDYEPYGYAEPGLIPVSTGKHTASRQSVYDRVIEAEILSQSTMVGC